MNHNNNNNSWRIRTLLVLPLICSSFLHLKAQVSSGGIPVTSVENLYFPDSLRNITIPEIIITQYDNNTLLSEEPIDTSYESIFRYGILHSQNISLLNSGQWDVLPDSSRIWRLQITSQNAYGLQLYFDQFYLPLDAELYIYSPDRSFTLGGFTSANNKSNGTFAVQPIPGNSIILELIEPVENWGQTLLAIDKVGHIYKNIFDNSGTLSNSCEINVNCDQCSKNDGAQRSVVKIFYTAGGYLREGTGVMVNNTAQDGKQYILTAYHNIDIDKNCQLSSSETETVHQWIFQFNYEAEQCAGTTSSVYQTLTGASLQKYGNATDYALVLINEEIIPTNYNVYLAGWDISGSGITSGYMIHHPDGDIKKITCTTNNITSDSWVCAPYDDDTHWEITWQHGVHEPGSSGAPLFNQNGLIIGQLSGGFALCTDNTNTEYIESPTEPDFFGKLDRSWADGLASALNNNNSWSGFTQNGINLNDTPVITSGGGGTGGGSTACCTVNPANKKYDDETWSDKLKTTKAETSITAEDVTIKNNSTITWTAGSYIDIDVDFEVEEGSFFSADIASCLDVGFSGSCGGSARMANPDSIGINEGGLIQASNLQNLFDRQASLQQRDSTQKKQSLANQTSISSKLKSSQFRTNDGELTIIPNPSQSGVFTITFNHTSSTNITVYNVLGEAVYQSVTNNPISIDIATHPRGIYFVQITNGGEMTVQKIVYQ